MRFIRAPFFGLLAAVMLLAGTASGAIAAPNRHQNWSHIHILFLIWSPASVPFFAPMVNGVHDAAKDQGIRVDIKYGNADLTQMNNIIQTALAGGT
ncbi:MAG: hypothetical protein ACREFP_01690, partial [Acetobacteraceae bacterium]